MNFSENFVHIKYNDLYKIIGCSKNSTCDQILVEYRKKALLLHPDKINNEKMSEEEARENFQKLQFAKNILTNPQKRKHYDLWMNNVCFSEFSLEDWMNSQEKIQQTLHWGHQREKEQLTGISKYVQGDDSWNSSSSPISRAFKDYNI